MATKSLDIILAARAGSFAPLGEAERRLRGLRGSALGVTDVFRSLRGLLGGFTAALAVKQSVSAFLEAERGETLLAKAIGNRADIQRGALDVLKDQARELQRTTTLEDDAAIAIQRLGIAQGLSVERTKSFTLAAANLAAVMGTDADAAAQQLLGTLAGQARGIARLIPEVKSLTKEQLASGAAIDLVNQKFKGFAVEEAGTSAGQLKQLYNTLGDTAEAVGQRIIAAFTGAAEGMKSPVQIMTDQLSKLNEQLQDSAKTAELIAESEAKFGKGRAERSIVSGLAGVGRGEESIFDVINARFDERTRRGGAEVSSSNILVRLRESVLQDQEEAFRLAEAERTRQQQDEIAEIRKRAIRQRPEIDITGLDRGEQADPARRAAARASREMQRNIQPLKDSIQIPDTVKTATRDFFAAIGASLNVQEVNEEGSKATKKVKDDAKLALEATAATLRRSLGDIDFGPLGGAVSTVFDKAGNAVALVRQIANAEENNNKSRATTIDLLRQSVQAGNEAAAAEADRLQIEDEIAGLRRRLLDIAKSESATERQKLDARQQIERLPDLQRRRTEEAERERRERGGDRVTDLTSDILRQQADAGNKEAELELRKLTIRKESNERQEEINGLLREGLITQGQAADLLRRSAGAESDAMKKIGTPEPDRRGIAAVERGLLTRAPGSSVNKVESDTSKIAKNSDREVKQQDEQVRLLKILVDRPGNGPQLAMIAP